MDGETARAPLLDQKFHDEDDEEDDLSDEEDDDGELADAYIYEESELTAYLVERLEEEEAAAAERGGKQKWEAPPTATSDEDAREAKESEEASAAGSRRPLAAEAVPDGVSHHGVRFPSFFPPWIPRLHD